MLLNKVLHVSFINNVSFFLQIALEIWVIESEVDEMWRWKYFVSDQNTWNSLTIFSDQFSIEILFPFQYASCQRRRFCYIKRYKTGSCIFIETTCHDSGTFFTRNILWNDSIIWKILSFSDKQTQNCSERIVDSL